LNPEPQSAARQAEACESLRLEQNAAVDELNRLNGN